MRYEIKEKNGKFYVIDTEDNNKIRGTYEDEDRAEDRKDELDFRAHVRSRIDRLPVTQMTAEEKAAEYDKMMADKNNQQTPPTDDNLPPKKDKVDDKPPKTGRSRYWGDQLDD
jgi:hypothetical protein